MKKILSIILMTVITSAVMAQGEVVSKYFQKYRDNDRFVKVSVSSKMFSLFTELEAGSEEEEEFLKAVSKLKGLKMVVSDSVPNAASLYQQALSDVSAAGFDELMQVMDAEENFQFSIKEDGGKIEELVMVAGGKKRFVLMSLYGEIDLKNISKLGRSMNIDGLSGLSKIVDEDN